MAPSFAGPYVYAREFFMARITTNFVPQAQAGDPLDPGLDTAFEGVQDYTDEVGATKANASHTQPANTVTFTPAGTIAATNVQAAIEEVASEAASGAPALFDIGTGGSVGARNLSGTYTIDMTGVYNARVGGVLAGATTINVIGTLAFDAVLSLRLDNPAGAFTLVFQRTGSSVSPSLRWANGAPSPVIGSGIYRYIVQGSPSGNAEVSRSPGAYS